MNLAATTSVASRLSTITAPWTWALALAAVLSTMLTGLAELCEFDRATILQGEIWRIFTGHLTHWNSEHLFWDLSVFLVLGTLCERRNQRRFLSCVVGTALASSLLMFTLLPEIPTYRGLSGIDTGLFSMLGIGIYLEARRSGDRWTQAATALMAAGLLGKLIYETLTGATIFVDHSRASFIPIVGVHLLGAIVGFTIALLEGITKKLQIVWV